MAHPDGYLGI